MKKIIFIALSGLLCSCRPKTVENYGGLIIDIELGNNATNQSEVASALNIFKNRIENIYENNPQVALSSDNRNIQIKLPLVVDTTWLKDYIIRKGDFITLETYENKEIYQSLININNKLVQNENYGYQFPVIISEDAHNFPLFTILTPSKSADGSLASGPMIGTAMIRDTALIDSVLHDKNFNDYFPADFDCKWSKSSSHDYVWLIAVKKPIKGKVITSDMILSAKISKGEYPESQVYFSMKPQYNRVWRNMTRRNMDRSLAIVIDDDVFSYPKILYEIKNGHSSIAGNMTNEQAKALVSILQYGPISVDFRIKKITIIHPSP